MLPFAEAPEEFISHGQLPPVETTESRVLRTYELFRDVSDGNVSTTYPALAAVSPDLFGVCLCATDGRMFAAGDADVPFAIMSVVKPFVFALVAQHVGPQRMRELIGVNSTGYPFNSIAAIERSPDGRTNPMVNSGAIATTSLTPGDTLEERWVFLLDGLSRFAGRPLSIIEDIYTSASATNHRNRAIVSSLEERGRIFSDGREALDLYTRVCALGVTARDLATMGATLADGGVNPVTRELVVDSSMCHYTIVNMVTAGMYETSGDWLYLTGLPGKSGIGGGIVTVAPGKGGLGTYAPPLDAAGNSVKGQLFAAHLATELGMDLFASEPSVRAR